MGYGGGPLGSSCRNHPDLPSFQTYSGIGHGDQDTIFSKNLEEEFQPVNYGEHPSDPPKRWGQSPAVKEHVGKPKTFFLCI